ncbi:hypothetical protein OSB04_006929 [Centaurea solstitialis]|uniref:Uncharacterized protein n=1 Tax=Centaurea solstitialis TaxID=347529 RepID=A0AA38WSA6_9ASTR|nr:hypothetical protein OSB04_006929 [Centaurea solstitialis]
MTRSRKRQETMDNSKSNIESPKSATIRRAQIKASKRVKGMKSMPTKLDKLNTRTSPKCLYETITGLNQKLKDAIKDMGLECLLAMRLNWVPVKMGFYVVNKLNTDKMAIDLPQGSIPITKKSIHDILRLLIGGIGIMSLNDVK